MATDNTRDVELRLAVKTQGSEAVKKIGSDIRALGKEAGDAAPQFVELANQVEKIGDQLQAVDTLSALTAEVKQLGEVQDAAAAKAKELGDELGKLRAATAQADAAEAAAKETLQATQRTLTEKRIELDKLKNSYDQAGKKTAEYQDAARKLKDEILAARSAILEQRMAYDQAKGAADKAEAAEKTLAKTYGEAAKAATDAAQAVEKRDAVLQASRNELEAQGVATKDLAAAQTTLVDSLLRTNDAAEILAIRMQQLRTAQEEEAAAADILAKTDAASRRLQEIQYAELLEEATRRLANAREEDARAARESAAAVEAEAKAQRDFAAAAEQARQSVLRSQYAAVFDELEASIKAAAAAQQAFEQSQREATAATEAEAEAQRKFQAAFESAQAAVRRSEYAKLFDEIDAKASAAAAAQQRVARAAGEVDAAFATLKVRNRAAIEADIAAINNALDVLARNARISGDEFDKAFNAGQGQIKRLQDELNGVTPPAERGAAGMRLFSSAIGQLTAAFGVYEAGRFVLNALNDLESLRRTLTIVTGSTDEAARRIEYLRKVADDAGVSIGDIGREFGRFSASMSAAGISVATTGRVFESVTKAVGLMGLSSADAEGALRALAQMSSKGKVSMEELSQQLGERLPAVLATTAKGLGLTTADLTKLIEQGKVLADEQFFSAFASGVEQSFGTATNQVEGLRASWARLQNAAAEAIGIMGDAGALDAIKGALTGLVAVLGPVVLGFSFLFDTIATGARQAGIAIAGLVTGDFKGAFAAMGEETDKMVARQARLSEVFQKAIGISDSAASSTREVGTAMQQAATGAEANATAQQQAAAGAGANAQAQQGAASAAQSNATAQAAAGAATTQAGQQAGSAATSWVALQNAYEKAITNVEKQLQTSEKLIEAKKLEGEVTQAAARLSGDEVTARQAALQASRGELSAMTDRLNLQQGLLSARNAEIDALKAYVAQYGDANGARQKEILALEQERDKMAATALQRQAEVEQQRTLVRERELATQSARDNAARLDELREASRSAQLALQQITQQYQQGLVPQQVYTEATRNAAAATNLYKDALADVVRNLELKRQAAVADAQVTQARIAAEQLNYQTLSRVAELEGNVAAATEYSVAAKRKQIDATVAAKDAKIKEANADIELLRAQRANITGSDDVSEYKRREIDLRIKAQQAKLIEAKASDSVVAGLNAEINALQRRNAAQAVVIENRGGANDGLPVGAKDNGDGTYTDAFGRKIDKATGQDKGAAPSSSPFSGPVDYTTRNDLIAKYRGGTLTLSDAKAAAANLEAARANEKAFGKVPGAKGFSESAQLAQAIVDEIRGIAVTKKPMNVTIGGKTTTVNAASEADAEAILKLLEQASGRSA